MKILYGILTLLLSIQSFSPANADAFAEKMSAHYGYSLRYEVRNIGTWLGATVATNNVCTTQVYLSDQFLGELGNDDLWKGVLAHEWAHTLQGSKCVNNEYNAEKMALQKLREARELSAYIRYAIFLQEKWGWTEEECYGVN